MNRISRYSATFAATAALLATTTCVAQAADPEAPAHEIAEQIGGVAPEADLARTVDQGETFVASNGQTSVSIPADANTPVTLASTDPAVPDLTVTLPSLTGTDEARQADDGTIVYTSDDDASIAVQPLADGTTRFLSILENKDATERFEYRFEGTDLRLQTDGSVLAYVNGASVGAVAPAWAFDAAGTAVPTHYEVDGDILTQVVDHTSGSFEYPITADPWWGKQYKLSSKDANKLAAALAGGGSATGIVAAICSGTIVGLPCGVVAGVAAGLQGIGATAIYWCNAGGKGININLFWNGWVTCTSR